MKIENLIKDFKEISIELAEVITEVKFLRGKNK